MADLKATRLILNEVEQLFMRDDDVQDIDEIKKMCGEIDNHYIACSKSAKDLIKQMTAKVSAKEAAVLAPSTAAHNSNLKQIHIEKENVSSSIENMRSIIAIKKDNITQISQKVAMLKDKGEEISSQGAHEDTKTAYALSLYSKISNITWDYSAPNHHLAGYIANSSTRDMVSFDLDTNQLSSFEVANALWDQISETMQKTCA